MEASKVARRSACWSSVSAFELAEIDDDSAGISLLSKEEGRGSGRMGGESGERQINGVSRVRRTFARSTRRRPRAAASAHLFQTAAAFPAADHGCPKRSTTSWTQ